MLKAWRLHHFKSVYDKTELELAPLTVFVGANSSGKSTVIQSLLLTAQTLQNPVPSRSVVLNGHILRLGTFNDVISNAPEMPTISVGFSLEPTRESRFSAYGGMSPRQFSRAQETIRSIECAFSFGAAEQDAEREMAQLQPRLEECEFKVLAVEPEHSRTPSQQEGPPSSL